MKKFVPAPILIPDPEHPVPRDLDEGIRSKALDQRFNSYPRDVALQEVSSPGSLEATSAISGSTLARALIANSFVLSSGEPPRSEVTRQDSATLPSGERLNVSNHSEALHRSLSVSHTHRMPSLRSAASEKHARSRSSSDSVDRITLGLQLSGRIAEHPVQRRPSIDRLQPPSSGSYSRCMSRIPEVSSTPSTPVFVNESFEVLQESSKNARVIPTALKTTVNSEGLATPQTGSDVLSTPPTSSSLSKPSVCIANSSNLEPLTSTSISHSLDEYSFMSPGPQTASLSSGSDSSVSYAMSLRRRNSTLRRRYAKHASAATSPGRGM